MISKCKKCHCWKENRGNQQYCDGDAHTVGGDCEYFIKLNPRPVFDGIVEDCDLWGVVSSDPGTFGHEAAVFEDGREVAEWTESVNYAEIRGVASHTTKRSGNWETLTERQKNNARIALGRENKD